MTKLLLRFAESSEILYQKKTSPYKHCKTVFEHGAAVCNVPASGLLLTTSGLQIDRSFNIQAKYKCRQAFTQTLLNLIKNMEM